MAHAFSQVDVFATAPLSGNPVAVVHDAGGLTTEKMAAFTRWMNLSESAFLLEPTVDGADYRVRIFAPGGELPFAGHPTLGSAHAWTAAGGVPADPATVVQQCDAGLVRLRREGDVWSFAAPEFLREGPADEADVGAALRMLNIPTHALVTAHWIDNGPGWLGLLLRSAEDVLAAHADLARLAMSIGIIGAHGDGGPATFEVRAFSHLIPGGEDPITGSLNAGFGVWLPQAGLAPPTACASRDAG
ncbi:hypothetical protein MSPP1_000003 [Malassezia sp. CBS 17886]|nr:hypothetical protein MSPP1_000003 [Malassezia sp. CBS 17886]